MIKTFVALLVTLCVGCVDSEIGGDSKAGDGLRSDDREGQEDIGGTRVCADGPTIRGIDVSYYQGTIDWNAVKASGIEFAFIRVSDGEVFKDPKFDTNWQRAKAAGVVRGAYQFFRPNQDVAAQIDMMVSSLGTYTPGDLPPVLDVENTGGLSASNVAARVDKWVAGVKAALGVTPIIYTGKYFWRDQVAADKNNADSTLWIAQWTTRCPTLPTPWTRWGFWQTSDKGSVPGIKGPVDLDQFNGSVDALVAYATGGGTGTSGGDPLPYYSGRSGSGSVTFVATPPAGVVTVEARIDDYAVGSATVASGQAIISYDFTSQAPGRAVELRGLDSTGAVIAVGNGLVDSTLGAGMFVDQTGDHEYEMGYDGYSATVEVAADGIQLADLDTNVQKSPRGMVRYKFSQAGARDLHIIARDGSGAVIADQHRTLTVR